MQNTQVNTCYHSLAPKLNQIYNQKTTENFTTNGHILRVE